MPSALTIVNWCPGDACDPCGPLLARLHPISAVVGAQNITETWGLGGSDSDLTGKTIVGGLIQCSVLNCPEPQPPYDFEYADGTWWVGQFGMQPPEAHYGSRPDPDGYDVTISVPGFSGSAHNTNIVTPTTPELAAGVEYSVSSFTLTATTTGYFTSTPGTYAWSSSFGDSMYIGGFAAWITYR